MELIGTETPTEMVVALVVTAGASASMVVVGSDCRSWETASVDQEVKAAMQRKMNFIIVTICCRKVREQRVEVEMSFAGFIPDKVILVEYGVGKELFWHKTKR